MNKEIKWWQVVLATIVVSVLGAVSTGMSKKNQRKLYERKLIQAPWAPPAKLFGPAWAVNNYFFIERIKAIAGRRDCSRQKQIAFKAGCYLVDLFFFRLYIF